MDRKRISILVLMFFLFTACSLQEPVPTPEVLTAESTVEAMRDELLLGMLGPLSDMSNLKQYEPAIRLVQALAHRALWKIDENMQLVPDLAQSYRVEVDAEGKRMWYVVLRPETFSDGSPLRAADVVSSLEHAKGQSLSDSLTDSWQEVRQVSDQEIALLESEQDNNLLYDLSLPTAYIFRKEDLARTDFSKIPGLGAYTIQSLNTQEAILQKRADAQVGMERITVKVFDDESSGLMHLEQGALDAWIAPSSAVFTSLEHHGDFQYVSQPAVTMTWLGFNTEIWPFNDANVRLAIDRALDKEKLLQVALRGAGQVSAHVDPWYNLGETEGVAPNLEEARAYLQKAGIRGSAIRLDILTTDRAKLLMYEVIKDDLEALGIRVYATSTDFDTYVTMLRQGDYKAYIGGYTVNQPEVFLNDMFASDKIGSSNVARFQDRVVDRSLQDLRLEKEQDLTTDRRELSDYLDGKLPYVPLFQSVHHLIYHKDLQGVELRSDGSVDPSLWHWKH